MNARAKILAEIERRRLKAADNLKGFKANSRGYIQWKEVAAEMYDLKIWIENNTRDV